MNRDVNNGVKFNPQKDLLPLYGDETAKGTFMARIAELADVTENDILAHDLYVYSRTPGSVWGASEEYISCGRLDDLQCAFSSLEGFLHAKTEKYSAALRLRQRRSRKFQQAGSRVYSAV